jgi:hypothetical protein
MQTPSCWCIAALTLGFQEACCSWTAHQHTQRSHERMAVIAVLIGRDRI